MKIKKKKGFTLIELIVVIAILGILAMIAIPRLMGFIGSSKTGSDTATMNTIQTAVTTAVANGEIATPAATSTIVIKSTTAVDTGSTATTLPASTGLTVEMQKYLGATLPVPQTSGKSTFTATIDTNGGVTVAEN